MPHEMLAQIPVGDAYDDQDAARAAAIVERRIREFARAAYLAGSERNTLVDTYLDGPAEPEPTT